MFDLLKRHEVQVLLRAGLTQRRVARLTGISVRSVRRIASEPPITSLESESFYGRRQQRAGRPSTVQGFRQFVVDQLSVSPRLSTNAMLQRARRHGYTGGASTFYSLVASVKRSVSFDAPPGAVAEHSLGRADVKFAGDTRRRVRFFVSRLINPLRVRVSIVFRWNLETFLRTLVDHYHAMGGAPLLAVFDGLDSIAFQGDPDGTFAGWNPVFADAVLQLGIAVQVGGAHAPRLVDWVKASFFRRGSFRDHDNLAGRLATWQREIDRAGVGTDDDSMAAKHHRFGLRPLRVHPGDFALRVPVCVGSDGRVSYEGNSYALPPEARNQPVTLLVYRDRIQIAAGVYRAEYPRPLEVNQRFPQS